MLHLKVEKKQLFSAHIKGYRMEFTLRIIYFKKPASFKDDGRHHGKKGIKQKINIAIKRFYIHVRVKNLHESIAFYNALFATGATVVKPDYAKWMLDDPRVNFAISTGHVETGIEHLGLQVDFDEALQGVYTNMQNAKGTVFEEGECTCCYSKSQKSWITDPQGIDWEAFYTHGTATEYGEGVNARPAPEVMEKWNGNDGIDALDTKELVSQATAAAPCNGTCSV